MSDGTKNTLKMLENLSVLGIEKDTLLYRKVKHNWWLAASE